MGSPQRLASVGSRLRAIAGTRRKMSEDARARPRPSGLGTLVDTLILLVRGPHSGRLLAGAGAVALGLAIGCATSRPYPPPSPPGVFMRPGDVIPRLGTRVEGVASWYGPGFHGKRTSNGEVYDMNGVTAAHSHWVFGTRVRVTFLATGRSVVVRVNDRSPNHKGRVIDLSKGAAKAIGLIGPGTGRVRLEVVELPAGL